MTRQQERDLEAEAYIDNLYWGQEEDVFVLFSRQHFFDLLEQG
jgi:hypothetical protein